MEYDSTGREKTYLVLLSFFIIANMFVPISFDKINILGNEASVPDGFVNSTILLIWLYFFWTFFQLNHWKFGDRHKSKMFTNMLQKYSKDKINEYAIKSGLYKSEDQIAQPGEERLKNPLTFHGCERVQDGFKLTGELVDNFGGLKKHTITIPKNEIFGSLILANFNYILKDPSFTRYTFPYVIASLAAVSVIYQIYIHLLS